MRSISRTYGSVRGLRPPHEVLCDIKVEGRDTKVSMPDIQSSDEVYYRIKLAVDVLLTHRLAQN